MRKGQRFSLIALIVPLILMSCLITAPAPWRTLSKPTVRRPIEVAFEQIHAGMDDEALIKIMAPFKKVPNGHGQWPCWTDGQWSVNLTLDIGGYLLEGKPIRVSGGHLTLNRLDGQAPDRFPVKGPSERLTILEE